VILLLGRADDSPLAAVASALRRRRTSFALLDQSSPSAPQRRDVPIDRPGGVVHVGGVTVDLDTITAAYLRPSFGGPSTADRILYAWADCAPVCVVNRPSAMAANNSKPYQASLIQRYGFAVAATLITTEPEAVRAFRARHGRIVYKSISGVRSIVTTLPDEDMRPLDAVRHCPTQFQAYVPGVDYRVHIVDEACLTCRIESDADDYRYAHGSDRPRIAASALPDSVAASVVGMVRGMGLLVAGVDLRLHPDGTWYCFEVNPSPAFTYFASRTGQPIADAIAALLAASSRLPRLPARG
jgi:glutathione synthase/RimK-type ligase-like ATP-grasp enzyme